MINKLKISYLVSITISFLVGFILLGKAIENINELNTVIQTQDKIAYRYLKHFGSPKNEVEQCIFDYIIYNDSTECKCDE